jgi:hypothetical protein
MSTKNMPSGLSDLLQVVQLHFSSWAYYVDTGKHPQVSPVQRGAGIAMPRPTIIGICLFIRRIMGVMKFWKQKIIHPKKEIL